MSDLIGFQIWQLGFVAYNPLPEGVHDVNGDDQPKGEREISKERFDDSPKILYTDGSGTSYVKISRYTEPHINNNGVQQVKNPRPKANRAEIASAIVAVVAFLASVGTLFGLYYTWKETHRSADAAICATRISEEALKLGRQEFASSEAAVLQPNISIREIGRGAFVQIDIINSGRIAATRVSVEIDVSHHGRLHLTNVTVPAHSASPDYPSGFITRTVRLNTPLDMQALAKQHLGVDGELNYWNGIGRISSKFCYGLTVSPYTGAPDWQDCENQETLQQEIQ